MERSQTVPKKQQATDEWTVVSAALPSAMNTNGIFRHDDCCIAERENCKGNTQVEVRPSRPDNYAFGVVFEAVKLMAERNIGALVVTEDEKVLGIITERDYARKIILMGR